MISATRLNGAAIHLNAEMIEAVESTPDTMITLTTGKKIMVSEPVDVIVSRVMQYRRRVHSPVLE